MSTTYGRNRQSISDIEQELNQIFESHPLSRLNQSDEPTIPADALPDVIREFSELYKGVELLADSEMEMLRALLASNPGIEVTPQVLLQFIAERTKHSPRESPGKSEQSQQLPRHSPEDSPQEEDEEGEDVTFPNARGRTPFSRSTKSSRSSSQSSAGTSKVRSRPPSVPPKTPVSGGPPSAFDTSRRQRTTPLSVNAPSSWAKRPAPASRRKSVDGGSSSRNSSDTESSVTSPSTWGRTPGRTRAPSNPSNPTSPSTSGLGSPPPSFASPPFGNRPHSRAHSQPFNSIGFHYSSPDRDRDGPMSPNESPDTSFEQSFDYPRGGADAFIDSISSLPMPRSSASDSGSGSDSDEDESSLGLVLDRSATSSTVSLEPLDKLDVLQKANAELGRKLMEADRALQNKLVEHDNDLEEMQARLEELRSELSATKREEKELRAKERVNSTQMAALESEIAKLQKSLENARTAYQSLQKQYQEQCAESERYRNSLRRRDQELKDLQDAAALQTLESHKYLREHDSYEERLAQLESELADAQSAHAQLDEQKQENLMLKETIDRMRFEMDEMRSLGGIGSNGGPGSASGSARGSVSKSLGAELLGKMGAQWGMEEDEEDGEGESMNVDGDDDEGTEGEEEDVIQTIITRKKRKVTGRANKTETVTFEETREYSDASTQYYSSEHTSVCATQTDPEPRVLTSTFAIQTEESLSSSFAIQTDPEPLPIPRITASIEIQTDEPEPEPQPEPSRSPSPAEEEEEALASSSSTVLPPTPKGDLSPQIPHTHPSDLPPSYSQAASQSSEPFDTLKKWHHGLQLPIGALSGGISEDATEEWRALKAELGVECSVINEIVEASTKTGPRPSSHHKSRFYNIYNTYVYGGDKDGPTDDNGRGGSFALNAAKQLIFCMGASACVYLVMGPYIAAQYTPVGGATYYDRAAWSSFNTMQAPGEGFGYDGTSALWNIVGRVGFGAARIAGGWPT
ncbi:hypothetical protein HYDPIDRAFT_177471 [Hydnomerulius pinastri MD-312]|uniref:Uncharacterized protein n=1 Tax=Hydnomerulius pinastri MD-312 TaxID=994086 RepID=A0A0C9V4I3_9AGAM|nr:hypothetical protein HYDPIDRAFT_177471 [Hydnomerulius pinastri MD-312]